MHHICHGLSSLKQFILMDVSCDSNVHGTDCYIVHTMKPKAHGMENGLFILPIHHSSKCVDIINEDELMDGKCVDVFSVMLTKYQLVSLYQRSFLHGLMSFYCYNL